MRALAAVWVALGLAACDPMVESDKPLFSATGGQAKPGLWAVLADGCAAPTTAAVQRWPACAMPVWVEDGALTFIMMQPMRTQFLIAQGSPGVLQMENLKDAPPGGSPPKPGYSYLAVEPEGRPPYIRGRVWVAGCSREKPPSITDVEATESECRASTAAGVRAALTEAIKREKPQAAVWVAPIP